MHVIRLLSASGGTEVGQFPFVIIKQPSGGVHGCHTVRISDGVYAQAPRIQSSGQTTFLYHGLVHLYSSADGTRPEQTTFQYHRSSSLQMSDVAKVGTKEFSLVMMANNSEMAPPNNGVFDFTYAEGFPVDLTSGNSTISRGYTDITAEDQDTPTIDNPPNFGSNWKAKFITYDSTQRNRHNQGNKSDWEGVVFKVIVGNQVSGTIGQGYFERVENGTTVLKITIGETSKADPMNGVSLYCCGTNGEDTLVVFGNNAGGMILIEADGTRRWAKDQLDANANDSSRHFISSDGAYAYSVNRQGQLFRIDLSDGSVKSTVDTYATSVPDGSVNNYTDSITYCGGFDGEGYLWVCNNNYNCLTRMDVSGANPVAKGSYHFKGHSTNGVNFEAPLADNDRVVCQIARNYGTSIIGETYFACFPTDFSVDTVDAQYERVYGKRYGIGSNTGEEYIHTFATYTTERTGNWGNESTSATAITTAVYTGSYDWDANAAKYDTIIANNNTGNVNIGSQSTLS